MVLATIQASLDSTCLVFFQGSEPEKHSHDVPELTRLSSTGIIPLGFTNWCFVNVCAFGAVFS